MSMRTTVTIDADVEQLLRDRMQRTRKSFKVTLNQAVRRGLRGTEASEDTPFQVQARSLGVRAGIDPGRLNQLNDDLEVDAFLETTERLMREGRGQA